VQCKFVVPQSRLFFLFCERCIFFDLVYVELFLLITTFTRKTMDLWSFDSKQIRFFGCLIGLIGIDSML